MISRRRILQLALVSPVLAALPRPGATALGSVDIVGAPSRVVPLSEGVDISRVKIERRWKGAVCQSQLVNQGREAVRIKEVVLFDIKLTLPATARLYGEGFQMLTQTG